MPTSYYTRRIHYRYCIKRLACGGMTFFPIANLFACAGRFCLHLFELGQILGFSSTHSPLNKPLPGYKAGLTSLVQGLFAPPGNIGLYSNRCLSMGRLSLI
jgi:hypothetical protein